MPNHACQLNYHPRYMTALFITRIRRIATRTVRENGKKSLSINQELLNDPNAPETREIYKQLIKLNFRYIKQRNIPKEKRTFYTDTSEETEGKKYLRKLKEKDEKRRKEKKKPQKVEDKVSEEKVARLQQKIIVKKPEKEDIRQLRVQLPNNGKQATC